MDNIPSSDARTGGSMTAQAGATRPPRRRRIWEIRDRWQCSVIGTCLTLDELRPLARKFGYRAATGKDTDYDLHARFVHEASRATPAARCLTKLLDRKYAPTIRRYARLRGEELEAAWARDSGAGKIAGPYWAVLTHPERDDALALRAYGEVHMFSHIAGGSLQADLAAQRRMAREITALKERLDRDNRRHHERVRTGERTIAALRAEISTLRGRLAGALPAPGPAPLDGAAADVRVREIEGLQRRLAAVLEDNRRLTRRGEKLSSRAAALQAEVRALEQALGSESPGVDDRPMDLGGRRILYVGGRARHVCRLRSLVADWNGDLVHHDGGLEKSLDLLARAVTRADAVVFPTDCVSHRAALKVKRLCHQAMKPYVPLRTSGVASFVTGLRDGLNGMSAAREQTEMR